MSKTRSGLVLMLGAVLFVRLVIRFTTQPMSGLTPEQIWMGQPPISKLLVLLGFAVFVSGVLYLIKGLTTSSKSTQAMQQTKR
jgi:hypothetical protein